MHCRRHYDVIVIGAGPAGSLAAAQLAAGGLRTVIVEKTRFQNPRVGEFLSPRVKAAINGSGVLDPDWERDHAEAWEFLSAWGSAATARRNYFYDPHGRALVLDRTRFDRSLASAAQRAGAILLADTSVLNAKRTGEYWNLQLNENGSEAQLSGSFLILCTGRLGRFRCLATRRRHIDKLVCFGLRLSNYRGDRRPMIEAYDHGWAYSVALPSGQLMVNICTEASSDSNRRFSRSFDCLLDQVAGCPLTCERMLEAAPANRADVEMFVMDASSAYTRPARGPGWCLAGDCAQSMDPLSSSGIAQAIMHAELISREILSTGSVNALQLEKFGSHLDTSYKSYLIARRQAYGHDKRWPTPFWQRRLEVAETLTEGLQSVS